jgi:hypothetical protein
MAPPSEDPDALDEAEALSAHASKCVRALGGVERS